MNVYLFNLANAVDQEEIGVVIAENMEQAKIALIKWLKETYAKQVTHFQIHHSVKYDNAIEVYDGWTNLYFITELGKYVENKVITGGVKIER